MEKKQAIQILQSRALISSPGRYVVKVSNCGDFHKELPNGQSTIAIANFGAMTPYQMGEAKKKLAEGDIAGALNHNLSLSIRDKDYRPAKGERVNIDVDFVTTKDGEQALLVVGLTPITAKSTGKCDFSDFLEEVVEETPAVADATQIS